jgi:PadR family transcriptional regulator, regulatory protein AphA
MSLRYALLGLLAEEPASGYDLTRRFEQVLQRYAWHAQNSQIYPELNQLSRDGLAAVVEEGPRGRRTYAITDAGREELRRWMRDPPDVYLVRNEFVLRLFLLSALEPAEARTALRQLAAENDAALATLREQVGKFDAAADPGAPPPLNRLVAEFGLRSYQTLREWAQWALDNIGETDAGASQGPGPADSP